MKASELIEALQAEVDVRGDREVHLSVAWPHEMYAIDKDEPIARGGRETHSGERISFIFIEAGDPA